jgi:hypothetical protein
VTRPVARALPAQRSRDPKVERDQHRDPQARSRICQHAVRKCTQRGRIVDAAPAASNCRRRRYFSPGSSTAGAEEPRARSDRAGPDRAKAPALPRRRGLQEGHRSPRGGDGYAANRVKKTNPPTVMRFAAFPIAGQRADTLSANARDQCCPRPKKAGEPDQVPGLACAGDTPGSEAAAARALRCWVSRRRGAAPSPARPGDWSGA